MSWDPRFGDKEALAEKYRGQAEFVFVYCREAHPDGERPPMLEEQYPELKSLCLPQTTNWTERAERAAWFARRTHAKRRILVDEDGENSVQDKFRASSNLLVVVDTQGRIVFREPSNAAALDKFLQQHLASP